MGKPKTTKKFFFIPSSMISAVTSDYRLIPANNTSIPRHSLVDNNNQNQFYIPEGISLQTFKTNYVPFFIDLPTRKGNILVNPHRIVQICATSMTDTTSVDVESDVPSGKAQVGGTCIKFFVSLPLGRVLELVDPHGYRVMKGDLSGRDLGGGQMLK